MNVLFSRVNSKALALGISVLGTLSPLSSSFAQTWVQTSAPLTNWQAIATSANGRKLVAAADSSYPCFCGGPIFTSADSGETWVETSAPVQDWRAVASSA